MTDAGTADAIALAERILVLLDEGARTATYKLAVLAALMDLCLEHTTRDGLAPDTLYTRPLAEKVIELYWPQTAAYAGAGGRRVLRQNTRGQAEIVTAIERFRTLLKADPGCALSRARVANPVAWEKLARTVEWKLIEMPLPRLQRVGGVRDELLYRIGWDEHVAQREVRENLVPAHARCNGDKSDLLAARTHVERWRARIATRGSDLATIARDAGFEQAPGRVLNVARGIYLLLPPRGRLWLHHRELELVGSEPLAPLFAPLAAG